MFKESKRVGAELLQNIFIGKAGNPAPVPTSIKVLLLKSINLHTVRQSTKCFNIISLSSFIAVRFIFSFHSKRSCLYFKNSSI